MCFTHTTGEAREVAKAFETVRSSTMGSATSLESSRDAGGAGAGAETTGMGGTSW